MKQSIEIDERPTLLVWDREGAPPPGAWIPILWRSFAEDKISTSYSIPRLVETRADFLRSRYLAWIYDLGEAHIDGKRLVDHLELRPALSYWWMTLPAIISYGHNTAIYSAVRLLALEQIAGELSPKKIIIASGDKDLARICRLWCEKAGLPFEWRKSKRLTSPVSVTRRLYYALPHPLQAMIWLLRYIKDRWSLRERGPKKPSESKPEITFFSYLIHLNQEAIAEGRFATYYWAGLHDVISQNTAGANWFHKYIRHEIVPSTRHARNLIKQFNHNGTGNETHSTTDGVLGWSVISDTLRDYGRVVRAGLRLCKMSRLFQPQDSNIDLWPLFKKDWHQLMYGTIAISNCLDINLCAHILQRLPRQRLGFYIQENQPWEVALIHAWRMAGHGQIIGVPHTTVLYWDTRYFFDPRTYRRTGKNDLPLPEKVALNGPKAMAVYRRGRYPTEQLVEVEALRYLYLDDLQSRQNAANEPPTNFLHVLVLGDYLAPVTRRQMQWLCDAATLLPRDTRYTVKPHPACAIRAGDYPSLQLKMTSSPLAELLSDCDVAFASNITSAAVDAYCAGVPVVSALDGNTFNMSPLRGLTGVVYVTGPEELARALGNVRAQEKVHTDPYFCLDKGLPRWRMLLGIGSSDAKPGEVV